MINARQLLEAIEARGGVASVKHGDNGVAVLNVAPRHVALDFASDIQRFKPALLEMLEPSATMPTDDEARARFPAHLRGAFCDSDQVAIGHCLLRLDAGEEIE